MVRLLKSGKSRDQIRKMMKEKFQSLHDNSIYKLMYKVRKSLNLASTPKHGKRLTVQQFKNAVLAMAEELRITEIHADTITGNVEVVRREVL